MTDKAKRNSAFIFMALPKTEFGFRARRNWAKLLRDATRFAEDTGGLAPPGQLSKVTGTACDE